jgi:antitoxin component YwqK of YwqJK toxin-antitoxin module|tara:strand:+ start:111 stop:899 length:789 start_codon:yes stop_codon:yes gene_type:complete
MINSLVSQIESGEKNLEDGKYNEIENDDGDCKESFEIKNGKLDGYSFTYHKRIKKGFLSIKTEWCLRSKVNYVNGKREGKELIYYDDGTINYENNYKDGKLDGEQYSYEMRLGTPEGGPNGLHREMTELDTYKNGVLHGKHETWILDTDISTGNYTSKRLQSEGNYVNGEKDGMWYEQLWSHPREDQPYKNGKRHGRWTHYCTIEKTLMWVDIYEIDKQIGKESFSYSFDGTSKIEYIDENRKTFKEETYDEDYNLIDTKEY